MLSYAAILPHAPLLLTQQSQGGKTRAAIRQVTQEIAESGLQNVITLGAHPSFHRDSYSVYIHPEYKVKFSDFGDLITSHSFPVWWDGYYHLRKASNKVITEIIDQEYLDYAHGIPLHFIKKQLGPPAKLKFLAVNIEQNTSEKNRLNFAEIMQQIPQDYALLICADLFASADDSNAAQSRALNDNLRKSLIQNSIPQISSENKNIRQSCLPEILKTAAPLIQDLAFQEISYEAAQLTDYLVARYEIR